MKHSKVFLGVTACLLGVAALAASKAKFNSITASYYTAGPSGSAGVCLTVTNITNVTITSTGHGRLTVPGTGVYAGNLLYTGVAATKCVKPLFGNALRN